MSQIGWFPRFCPDGTLYTWERPNYWRAQYVREHTEIADNGTNLVIAGQPTTAPTCNELGAGGGVWAACRTDPVRVFTSTGLTIPGAGSPAVNPDGKIAYVDDRQALIKNLIFDGQTVARGGITDVRCSRTVLVWRDNGQTWGGRLDYQTFTPKCIQVAPEEFGPIPVDTPFGPWVLCYTQTGLILRPFDAHDGYRFDNDGQTYYPDAVYRNNGIEAIFTNDRGEQSTQPFDLNAPRVPLGAPMDRQPGPIVHTVPFSPAPRPAPSQEHPMIAYAPPVPGFKPGDLHDNGNGTVSVQKPNGKWLCVNPQGGIEERDNGGGLWESFRRGKTALIAERDGGASGPQVYVLPLAE